MVQFYCFCDARFLNAKALSASDNATSLATFAGDAFVSRQIILDRGMKATVGADWNVWRKKRSMVFLKKHPVAVQPKDIKIVLQERDLRTLDLFLYCRGKSGGSADAG